MASATTAIQYTAFSAKQKKINCFHCAKKTEQCVNFQ